MGKTQNKRKAPKNPCDSKSDRHDQTIPEQPAKRPKLSADPENEKRRLPDDVLIAIFGLLSVRDRMRLSFVSKRFRQLVHLRTVWKTVHTLSLTLEGKKDKRMATINGHKFEADRRTSALRLLLDLCAPFKRVEICVVVLELADDMSWMSLFLDRLLDAKTLSGKAAPLELSFRGYFRYAPVVFEKLIDGTQTKIEMEIIDQNQRPTPKDWNNLKKLWSKIAICDGLTEFNFGCSGEERLFDKNDVLAALRGKGSLRKLGFKIADSDPPRPVTELADVVNSCPSLVALNFAQRHPYLGITDFSQAVICFLTEETMHRLQEYTIDGPPNFDINRDRLATECPNLKRLTINLVNAAPIIELFLVMRQVEDKILYMDITVSGRFLEKKHSATVVHHELKPLCDRFAMAPDGRYAFIKGSAVVAVKFVEQHT